MSDTFLTTRASAPTQVSDTRVRKGNPGQPHCIVRHQSASVPIYAGDVHGKTRFTISYFLDGRRKRRMFTDLDAAKREAKLVAEKIQKGLQSNNDLRPAEIAGEYRSMVLLFRVRAAG